MKTRNFAVVAALTAALVLPFTVFAAKGEKKPKAEPPPAFATVDKDSNGSIEEAEYVAAVKGRLTEEAAKTQFAALDKNHDGKLSSEEYAADTGAAKKVRKKKNAN